MLKKNKYDANLHNSFEYKPHFFLANPMEVSSFCEFGEFQHGESYHTQNEIKYFCSDAQYYNPPFLFLIHPLYTNTLFNSKTYKPTLLPFFRSFQTHPF